MSAKTQVSGRNCRWFLQPLNDHTNEAIARALAEKAEITEISQCPTNDGNTIMVWECPFEVVNAFVRSTGQGMKFHIFNCAGRQRVIRKCDWFTDKKRKKPSISKGFKPKSS